MHTNAYEALECIRNAYEFNRYYSLPCNGNDSTERRDMEEIEGWEPHPTHPIIPRLMQTMFLWRLSDCEELVSSITGDDVIDIERNIFI